jgi:hypothetical protein
MSEYILPILPSQTTSILVPLTEKKTLLIKSLPTKSTPAKLVAAPVSQGPISIFLRPTKSTPSDLTSRKSSLLDRIRAKQSIENIAPGKLATAAWERGEWCINGLFLMLATHPGKMKVAVSLSGTITQLKMSSTVPLSEGMVRDVLDVLCTAVPWFCRVIRLECTSSQSIKTGIDNGNEKKENGNGKREINARKENLGGKENVGKKEIGNGRGKDVEGLLIFSKRDGRVIGREDVLKEFRMKRQEWEKQR